MEKERAFMVCGLDLEITVSTMICKQNSFGKRKQISRAIGLLLARFDLPSASGILGSWLQECVSCDAESQKLKK
jgi:hypothetical protein